MRSTKERTDRYLSDSYCGHGGSRFVEDLFPQPWECALEKISDTIGWGAITPDVELLWYEFTQL